VAHRVKIAVLRTKSTNERNRRQLGDGFPSTDPFEPYDLGRRKGFGVDWKTIKLDNGAVHANVVEDWCMRHFKDRKVIVHSGYHDQIAFYLRKPFENNGNEVIDTQVLYSQRKGCCSLAKSEWTA
jgi:hypothetical protein